VSTVWRRCGARVRQSGNSVATVWRQCGEGVATVCRQCGISVSTVWWHCGDGVATVWRRCGDVVAIVWRQHSVLVFARYLSQISAGSPDVMILFIVYIFFQFFHKLLNSTFVITRQIIHQLTSLSTLYLYSPNFWQSSTISYKKYRVFFSLLTGIKIPKGYYRRSRWPRGLRRTSTAAHMLRLWFRIPPGAWKSVCCKCCVLSGRGLCDELITRSQ